MSDDHAHEVPPGFLKRWQHTLDEVAAALDVPAALVMRVWPEQIEVLLSSLSSGNPYEQHEKADLGTGLYCETVMASRALLEVPDALNDPAWRDNPDARLKMIHYLGVPLVWPDDSIFGTVCVLDARARQHSAEAQEALWKIKALIEADFAGIFHGDTAPDATDERARRIDTEVAVILARLRQAHCPRDREVVK
jgi:hypothetical protein